MDPKLLYRQAAVRGASPVRLVILLYEQLIEDLRRSLDALRRGDIETRTREINHALLVIGYLQATLDKDKGGQVALNLERFYRQLRTSLMEAQRQQSFAELERQISLVTLVHSAWCKVEQEAIGAPSHEIGSVNRESDRHTPADWNA